MRKKNIFQKDFLVKSQSPLSLHTGNNLPYASKERREASETVIISDSIDAANVITMIII